MNSKIDIKFSPRLDFVAGIVNDKLPKEFRLDFKCDNPRAVFGGFFSSIPRINSPDDADNVLSDERLSINLGLKKKILGFVFSKEKEFLEYWEKNIKPVEEEYKVKYEEQLARFDWLGELERLTKLKFPFKTLTVFISSLMIGGDSRPDLGIVVESTSFDMCSVMHEAGHVILRQGKLDKSSDFEEVICLFLEAKFRELCHGKFLTNAKDKILEQVTRLRNNLDSLKEYGNIITWAEKTLTSNPSI